MALFDALIGGDVSAVAGDKTPALNDFLKTNGGITGLAQKFQSGGAGEVFSSWVGTGQNQAITAETINQVPAFAQKLGIDPAQASDFIAQHLPQRIDKLTPEGQMPACGQILIVSLPGRAPLSTNGLGNMRKGSMTCHGDTITPQQRRHPQRR